ncbi:MAG: hypothetical protein HXX17_05055 [Geobacteraceae bacterium]|nr:hypothetical protein [Geobacteraceae bacterium]
MKMIAKVLLTAAAIAALAAPALAANDKLIVKDVNGTTDVFKVQDDGSFIGGKIKFDATGSVSPDYKFKFGVGTTTPTDPFTLQHDWAVAGIGTQTIFVASSINDVSRFTVRRANGVPGALTATTAGQQLGNFNFRGHDGTNFSANGVGAITSSGEEAFTPTSQSTRIAFVSTPVGAIAGVERVRVPGAGGLRIMTATQPPCDASGAATSSAVGTIWFTAGASGVKDSLQVCAKDAANAYAWRTIY